MSSFCYKYPIFDLLLALTLKSRSMTHRWGHLRGHCHLRRPRYRSTQVTFYLAMDPMQLRFTTLKAPHLLHNETCANIQCLNYENTALTVRKPSLL